MKQLQARGETARYAGQIGRTQFHYTVADRPLMQQVFEEDLWPARMPAATSHTGALISVHMRVREWVSMMYW